MKRKWMLKQEKVKIKRVFVIILSLVVFLSMTGCSGNGILKSPIGSYGFGSTSFKLDNKSSFWLEHIASADDQKHYTITGTYTYTLDHTDSENEISYGKIDISVTVLTLDGVPVNSLDFTTIHTGTDVSVNQKLLGWWKYMNLITYSGKMRIGLNLPFKGYRPEDVDTGRDWLFIGDPK
jgi:hypothetical protein